MTTGKIVTATVRIAAPPDEVFDYFVDPALMTEWIGHWADLRPEPGGLFALDVETSRVRGRFLVVEPPRRVVFTWGVPGDESLPEGSTTVEVRLTADGSDTMVELVHRDLPADQRSPHRAGWTRYLGRLTGVAGARPGPG